MCSTRSGSKSFFSHLFLVDAIVVIVWHLIAEEICGFGPGAKFDVSRAPKQRLVPPLHRRGIRFAELSLFIMETK